MALQVFIAFLSSLCKEVTGHLYNLIQNLLLSGLFFPFIFPLIILEAGSKSRKDSREKLPIFVSIVSLPCAQSMAWQFSS